MLVMSSSLDTACVAGEAAADVMGVVGVTESECDGLDTMRVLIIMAAG